MDKEFIITEMEYSVENLESCVLELQEVEERYKCQDKVALYQDVIKKQKKYLELIRENIESGDKHEVYRYCNLVRTLALMVRDDVYSFIAQNNSGKSEVIPENDIN